MGTAANINDVTQAHRLVHGQETDVFADAGYQGVAKREEVQGLNLNWHVAMRPGKRRALDKNSRMGAILDQLEHIKCPYLRLQKHQIRHHVEYIASVPAAVRVLNTNQAV